MDTRNEIREFLTTRRARITPEQAGLRTYGSGPRRVPGLRREEVALLAGVSVDYYTRLERGNAAGVSETVLEALARALQLDDTERGHLFDLVRARSPRHDRVAAAPQRVRPGVQRMLDAMTAAPAFVRNGRHGHPRREPARPRALLAALRQPARPPNTARFVFLDTARAGFYADWEQVATDAVAILRAEAGRDPYDRDLSDLVGELSTRSELFRTRWAAHNVRTTTPAPSTSTIRSSASSSLTFETMQLVADPGLTMFVYTAEPGSRTAEALNLLASWTSDTKRGDCTMQITRNSLDTGAGPERLVHRRGLHRRRRSAVGSSRVSASSVHFTPGARTAWHTHPNGQTIWVTRRRRPLPAPRRPGRADPSRRPRLLRARRGSLARRRIRTGS